MKASISVDSRNKFKLKNLKRAGESYNDVITRLIGDLVKTGEYHYLLYNGLFKISFVLNYKDKKGFFLDEKGNKSEKLEIRNNYNEPEIQKSYTYFIKAINEVMKANYDLVKYAFDMDVGEIKNFDGFLMERIY